MFLTIGSTNEQFENNESADSGDNKLFESELALNQPGLSGSKGKRKNKGEQSGRDRFYRVEKFFLDSEETFQSQTLAFVSFKMAEEESQQEEDV